MSDHCYKDQKEREELYTAQWPSRNVTEDRTLEDESAARADERIREAARRERDAEWSAILFPSGEEPLGPTEAAQVVKIKIAIILNAAEKHGANSDWVMDMRREFGLEE